MQDTPAITNLLTSFVQQHKLDSHFIHTASKWYIPLCERIKKHQNGAKHPFFIGLNGCQGSGKSTLSELMAVYLTTQADLSVVVLSLDDFYYAQPKRGELAADIHPLLKTRGVPGTHNTELMQQVLSALQQGIATKIPRFNKATDNPLPMDQWPYISTAVDIVIVEGWCWGVTSQDADALAQPVNHLEQAQDPQGTWRTYVNEQLTEHYLPLYDFMDYWLLLRAPSFECVYRWRVEQEQKLAAALSADQDASALMSPAQVKEFIQHYQRLTEHGLASMPENCDCILSLDSKRSIQDVTYKHFAYAQ